MTTMTNSIGNGRRRPSLCEQINRLDNMLDGLSEGLNDAVADAVKTAVAGAARDAVQSVLADILTSPAMIAKLQTALAPQMQMLPRVPAPTAGPRLFSRDKLQLLWAGIRTGVAHLRAACGNGVRRMQTSAADLRRRALANTVGLWARCQIVRRCKYQILTALGIGAMVGVVAWHAGPWLAAAASGVGGFATSLSVQAGLWLHEVLGANSDAPARA